MEEGVVAGGGPAGAVLVDERPVRAGDARVGFNDAFAAVLTRAVGSMPALYVVLVVVGGWMALAAWGPLRHVDPYPFAFLLFLDNVVQLVLCLVILVGQRVLGQAADKRAEQTYQNAEAIFAQIVDLQEHLDRHDRAFGRGASLLESSAHPWIERHKVQSPPRALDQAVGANGRIAAWLTRRLGSMWAFYLAAATQVVWMGSAWLGLQSFDPYPFAFMSFLSTLAQLIFMIVIMVGQGVLEQAADGRSEQTFLNAEAILHECRRMKTRLTAQDRLIDMLSGYTAGELSERLARAIYEADARGGLDRLAALVAGPGRRWERADEREREQARARARRLGEQLAKVGMLMVPAFDLAAATELAGQEAETIAKLEYEAAHAGSVPGGAGSDRAPWERLSAEARAQRVAAVCALPGLLGSVGMKVVRDGRLRDGAGEAEFAPGQWAAVQRALMAAGVLVAGAEGVVDAEEMYVLIKTLRDASLTHSSRLIREAAASSTFETGLAPGTRYADYAPGALQVIGQASTAVAEVAPVELPAFRAFLAEIAEAVAAANREGGVLGIAARPRTSAEADAVDAVRRAGGQVG